MILAYLRRGLAAGLVAGLLAGLIGLIVGEPNLDAAVALEGASANHGVTHERARGHEHSHGQQHGADTAITRPMQKAGLVAGGGLAGMAVGALFGVVAAWAVGRLTGDGWTRSLKLGAAVVGATVILPALKYPPNPPGVGDPETVGLRTGLYLGLVFIGLLLAATSWVASRQLSRTKLSRPVRQAVLFAGTVAAAALILAALPAPEASGSVPNDLLWSFRVSSLAMQLALYGGTAAVFGLLSAQAERPAVSLRPARSGG